MEYLVIDTESCTGRSDDGSLCSLGYAICDENLNVIRQEDLLFNPHCRSNCRSAVAVAKSS